MCSKAKILLISIVLGMVLSYTALGLGATAPGSPGNGWYDQDKNHAEGVDGVSGLLKFDDLDHDGVLDVGEPYAASGTSDPNWTDVKEIQTWWNTFTDGSFALGENTSETPTATYDTLTPDNSCWMAATWNMLRNAGYSSALDYYNKWAFTEGVQFKDNPPQTTTYDFTNRGMPYKALSDENGIAGAPIAYQHMNNPFASYAGSTDYYKDPVEWLLASLKENAVCLGVYDSNDNGHAITLYSAIFDYAEESGDGASYDAIYADSDSGSAEDGVYSECYLACSELEEYNAYSTIVGYPDFFSLRTITALDKIGWLKTDQANQAWSNESSWLGGTEWNGQQWVANANVPDASKPVYFVEGSIAKTIATLTINGNASAKSFTMSVNENTALADDMACLIVADNGNLAVSEDIYLGVLDYKNVGRKGWIKQESGSSVSADNLYLGYAVAAYGQYDIESGATGLNIESNVYVGYEGDGVFNQSGSASTIGGSLYLGKEEAGNGTYTFDNAGAELTVEGNIYVGVSGQGRFNWLTQGELTTSAVIFSTTNGNGTLAMGFVFDLQLLANGSSDYFKQTTTITGLAHAHLEVTDGITGSYSNQNGNIILYNLTVGSALGAGTFNHSNGTLTISNLLTLGDGTNNGTYTLSGGTLNVKDRDIKDGSTFTHSGGTLNVTGTTTNAGVYNVTNSLGMLVAHTFNNETGGTASISGNMLLVGASAGDAVFDHNGGNVEVRGHLMIGTDGTSTNGYGEYHLDDGLLSVISGGNLLIGKSPEWDPIGHGTAVFTQDGGAVQVGSSIIVGGDNDTYYEMTDGTIQANCLVAGGCYGYGRFEQDGEDTIVTVGNLYVGCIQATEGNYLLKSGNLMVQKTDEYTGTAFIGNYGVGNFIQTGGTFTLNDGSILKIGEMASGQGTYYLQGGSFDAWDLLVGEKGTLIVSGSGEIEVRNSFTLHRKGTYDGPPLPTGNIDIHMTGANFYNTCTSETDVSGLSSTNFIFEGGVGVLDTFEIAGEIGGGFETNFAVGKLTLGSETEEGHLQLVDDSDNDNRGTYGQESQYVHELEINTDSTLDVNDLKLYVEGDVTTAVNAMISDGRLVNNGTLGAIEADYLENHDWTYVGTIIDWDYNGTGAWNTATNWDLDTVPTSSDYVRIDNAGTAEVGSGVTAAAYSLYVGYDNSGTVSVTGGTLNIEDTLSVAKNSGSTGTVTISSGTLTVGGDIVGGAGTSFLYHNGGTFTVGGDVTLFEFKVANEVGSTASFEIGEGSANYTLGWYGVGIEGNGTVTQEGGNVSVEYSMGIGFADDSDGTYNQSGGTLTVTGTLEYGWDGLYIGYESGGEGEYNLSGGSLTTLNTHVAYLGTGTFNQSGGTHTIETSLYIGSSEYNGEVWIYGAGTYNMTGGTLEVEGSNGYGVSVSIGDFGGSGEFNHSGGTITITDVDGVFLVGNEVPHEPSAEYNLSGTGQLGTSLNPINIICVGNYGHGEIEQDGADTNVYVNSLYVGYGQYNSSYKGLYELKAGTLTVNTVEYIGHIQDSYYTDGNGEFIQSGGTHNVDGTLYLGYNGSSVGVYTLSGGTLEVEDDLRLGEGSVATGTLTISGGTLDVGGYTDFGRYGTGTVTMTDGNFDFGLRLILGNYTGSSGSFTASGGTISGNELVVGKSGSGSVTISGADVDVRYLKVGHYSGGTASLTLSSGSISVENEANIGILSAATFIQSGGTFDAESMVIGHYTNGTGTVNLSGGTFTIETTLDVGIYYSAGTINASGGTLNADELTIGAVGALNVTNNAAVINITSELCFDDGAEYDAVSGTQINMDGADFTINVDDSNASDVGGLDNTTFVFEGGSELSMLEFEVAGNSTNQFKLYELEVGTASTAGFLQLVDNVDNSTGYDNLYLSELTIDEDSILDVNHLQIYVDGDVITLLEAWVLDGRLTNSQGMIYDVLYDSNHDWTFLDCMYPVGGMGGIDFFGTEDAGEEDGGVLGDGPTQVPEPGTIVLLGAALVGMAGIIRRKMIK